MTATLSLALLCQKRKSLSSAVLGLSLPCLVPAHRALSAFQMTCHAHLTCHIQMAIKSHQQGPTGTNPWVKIKGFFPAVAGSQQVPCCVPCPSPGKAVPLLSRHSVPHGLLSPTAM